MNTSLLRLIFIILCLTHSLTKAQDYTGIWRGYITAGGLYNRGLILHVKHQDSYIITGRSYLFDITLAGSSTPGTLRGIMDFVGTTSPDGLCKISELAILDSLIPNDQTALCKKILSLSYRRENKSDVLTGTWNGATYNRIPCTSGKVILQKYPDGKIEELAAIPASISENTSKDSLSQITFQQTRLSKPIIVNISSPVIKLELNDYLREDGDIVSVYYNRNRIINKHRIKKKKFIKTITLDRLSGLSEIVVYAENLGEVPPNTCTMVVNDGKSKQTVNITSDQQTSAAIYLIYSP